MTTMHTATLKAPNATNSTMNPETSKTPATTTIPHCYKCYNATFATNIAVQSNVHNKSGSNGWFLVFLSIFFVKNLVLVS